ncbi:prolipoprotein diacylglyceryl transferase [Prosthecobacter sp.]|uniref:prolipoprotein diacylglyceryl transferase n=1 Tax=Prosthecobacter sp. TaxID=1965333 RepID=UPI00378523EA
MFFATYLHDLSPFIFHTPLRWYGLAYVLGFYLTYRVMYFLAQRGLSEIKADAVADFITMVSVFGLVLGGRVGYMLLYNFDTFIHAPWTLLMVWQGGMASHGGIAGVTLFCGWYAWKHKISWAGIGDSIVCGAPLGIFLGRIANFINGELFGRVTTSQWAMKFPTELTHEDFIEQGGSKELFYEIQRQQLQHSPDIIAYFEDGHGGRAALEQVLHPRYPSQLYEALGEGLFLSAILIFIRLRFPRLRQGIITGLFFFLYAIARIALEFVREPDSGSAMIMGLTKGQFFSTFMFVVGGLFIAYGLKWGKSPPGPAAAAQS